MRFISLQYKMQHKSGREQSFSFMLMSSLVRQSTIIIALSLYIYLKTRNTATEATPTWTINCKFEVWFPFDWFSLWIYSAEMDRGQYDEY